MDYTTPPQSLTSSPSMPTKSTTTTTRPTLSLDLTNLPALSQPATPTNTLIITDLNDLHLFDPPSLSALRNTLNNLAPLNSFSPLPSLRRLLCSFHTATDALYIRKLLSDTSTSTTTNPLKTHTNFYSTKPLNPKIYFGETTPLQTGHDARPKLLAAPQVDKLFFISPPPSPPHGWVLRQEDPPNKEVHASDLAHALSKLNTEMDLSLAQGQSQGAPETPVSAVSDKQQLGQQRTGSWPTRRSRSSTLIYHPEDHGGSPGLPAVMVEDMSSELFMDEDVEMGSPLEVEDGDEEMDDEGAGMMGMSVKRMPPKTARPPVELM
ncbi:putative calcineurin binding protein [Aspergillus homomorphus CBS 101889]|uniref:Calcipressin n=1 Tax=Aspergillus homomorphus (strain CBS 101889) TaxID=1450537 RepID=A0A395IC81_ASPHC|nr:Calcipressin [Aspergillus homomorphus CBS 101889]RAL17812.1 Calcipressin [Aspergillus homomorphus CBS 101889]